MAYKIVFDAEQMVVRDVEQKTTVAHISHKKKMNFFMENWWIWSCGLFVFVCSSESVCGYNETNGQKESTVKFNRQQENSPYDRDYLTKKKID